MRTKQFRIVLSTLFLALFGFGGCLEQKVKTTVFADGSCERTFVVGADSGSAPLTRLPLPTDSTWTIRWEKQDTLRREGFTWIASKKYPSLASLSKDADVPAQPGKIRIAIEADRSFRWFYTYIHFRETYYRFAPIDRVPPTAVMTPEEIRRFSAGEENDSLKSKVEEWKHRNIADLFFCTLDTLNDTMGASAISSEMLRAHREDLTRNLSARKEINESLSEYLPSLTRKDLFQDSPGAGMRPKVRLTERSQPQRRPAISAPPLVLKLSGTPPTVNVRAPTSAPMTMPAPMTTMSVCSVARSA
jgi:hypothetical protein